MDWQTGRTGSSALRRSITSFVGRQGGPEPAPPAGGDRQSILGVAPRAYLRVSLPSAAASNLLPLHTLSWPPGRLHACPRRSQSLLHPILNPNAALAWRPVHGELAPERVPNDGQVEFLLAMHRLGSDLQLCSASLFSCMAHISRSQCVMSVPILQLDARAESSASRAATDNGPAAPRSLPARPHISPSVSPADETAADPGTP